MRIELPQIHVQELREYVAARRDAMLSEIDHTDSSQFKRLLRGRYDRLEEILGTLDAALAEGTEAKSSSAL
jgi:hypothetical protein